jgi:very-short-patch-repair endonuclease
VAIEAGGDEDVGGGGGCAGIAAPNCLRSLPDHCPPLRHALCARHLSSAIRQGEDRGRGGLDPFCDAKYRDFMENAPSSRSRRKAGVTARARSLRRGDNAAEGALWNELKLKRLGGLKFVRQLPIGPYFADFVCRSHRLVVEVDGSQHVNSSYDRERDAFMRDAGYSVLRVWNIDVLRQMTAVCDTILAALEGRLSEDVVAPDLRFVFGAARKPEV